MRPSLRKLFPGAACRHRQRDGTSQHRTCLYGTRSDLCRVAQPAIYTLACETTYLRYAFGASSREDQKRRVRPSWPDAVPYSPGVPERCVCLDDSRPKQRSSRTAIPARNLFHGINRRCSLAVPPRTGSRGIQAAWAYRCTSGTGCFCAPSLHPIRQGRIAPVLTPFPFKLETVVAVIRPGVIGDL